jgi:hypothetical protein
LASPILVVSNPPQGVLDARRAAPPLGLTPAEATLKVHYPVPEIWLAFDGRAEAQVTAQELMAAGLHVTLVPAEELANVPPRTEVRSFTIQEAGLALTLTDETIALARDAPVIAVFCAPREAGGGASEGRPPGSRTSEPMRAVGEHAVVQDTRGFLDLYLTHKGALRRVSVVQGVTDFSGFGESALPSPAGNLIKFVAEIEAHFKAAQVDRRLALLQARRRTSTTGVQARVGPSRKGLTYGTTELKELLGAIAPELKDVSEYELSSRLAYMTRR